MATFCVSQNPIINVVQHFEILFSQTTNTYGNLLYKWISKMLKLVVLHQSTLVLDVKNCSYLDFEECLINIVIS